MTLQKELRFGSTITTFLLILALAGCGGYEAQYSSEAEPSSDPIAETTGAPVTVAELIPDGEETSAQAVPPETEGGASSAGELASCEPTLPDMLGPFYEPDAPVRTSVDSGYVLSGTVLAAGSCEPVPGARIELWLANSQGVYDEAHRATVPAGDGGEYRFESNVPVPYENRPPHIHVRVSAPGYGELVTQHYPQPGQTEANFDLVLEPV